MGSSPERYSKSGRSSSKRKWRRDSDGDYRSRKSYRTTGGDLRDSPNRHSRDHRRRSTDRYVRNDRSRHRNYRHRNHYRHSHDDSYRSRRRDEYTRSNQSRRRESISRARSHPEDAKDWLLISNNKHCEQVRGIYLQDNTDNFSRSLDYATAPTREYYERKRWEKTTLHWGQRKLLMSEIEFLTLYGLETPCNTVVYAGAAPGVHTNFLSDLFPFLKFVLVDPNPFTACSIDFTLEEQDVMRSADAVQYGKKRSEQKLELHEEYFTNEWAKDFHGSDALFISDIRTGNFRQMKRAECEHAIVNDNKWQKEWVEFMRPLYSMLKFRMPYPDSVPGASPYFDGDIRLPVWGPQSTTETRLIVSKAQIDLERSFDHVEYERKMFYFNTITRVQAYKHPFRDLPGMDCCYDCFSEVYLLREYFNKFGVSKYVRELCEYLQEIRGVELHDVVKDENEDGGHHNGKDEEADRDESPREASKEDKNEPSSLTKSCSAEKVATTVVGDDQSSLVADKETAPSSPGAGYYKRFFHQVTEEETDLLIRKIYRTELIDKLIGQRGRKLTYGPMKFDFGKREQPHKTREDFEG